MRYPTPHDFTGNLQIEKRPVFNTQIRVYSRGEQIVIKLLVSF